MTDYYLIPTLWSSEKPNCIPSVPDHTDWIRLVNCSHQKKEQITDDYERELNNGELFSMEKVVQGKTLYCVIAIPYSQARDYRSFSQWPCNKEGDTEYNETI